MILVFLVCLIIFALISAIAMIPFLDFNSSEGFAGIQKAFEDYSNPRTVMGLKVAQIISAIGTFIIPAFLFAFLVTRKRTLFLGIKQKPFAATLLITIVLMVFALPVINWLAEINSHLDLPDSMSGIENWMRSSEAKAGELTRAFLADTSVGGLILNLFVVAFLAAVGEELFFRGAMQRTLMRGMNVHAAVWITAIVFSAIHMQFFGFLPRMMLGALLGYLFVWSGSLWISICAHFMNNGLAVLFTWLSARGSMNADVDKVGMAQDQVMYTVVSVIAVTGLLVIIYMIERKRPKADWDDKDMTEQGSVTAGNNS